jgi:hypothetical protein
MAGRAGRSGQAARAILLWSGADPKKRFIQFEDTFPDGEVLCACLHDVARLFPATPCRFLLEGAELARRLNFSEKLRAKRMQGLVTALRLMGMLENPLPHEHYFEVDMCRGSLQQTIDDLPPGLTRRSRFWNAVATLSAKEWRLTARGRTILLVRAIVDESRLSWARCAEILDHYQARHEIGWRLWTPSACRDGFLVDGTVADAMARLPAYLKMRAEFLESLVQLEELARAQECRLVSSATFFSAGQGTGMQGGDRRPGAVFRPRCEQCDLCTGQQAGQATDPAELEPAVLAEDS